MIVLSPGFCWYSLSIGVKPSVHCRVPPQLDVSGFSLLLWPACFFIGVADDWQGIGADCLDLVHSAPQGLPYSLQVCFLYLLGFSLCNIKLV